MVTNWVAIALAGTAGVLTRAGVQQWCGGSITSLFLINVVGSFGAGVVAGLAQRQEGGFVSEALRQALMVGFLGGFTTYSGYALESMRLVETRGFAWAGAYAAGTAVGAFGAVWLGLRLTAAR